MKLHKSIYVSSPITGITPCNNIVTLLNTQYCGNFSYFLGQQGHCDRIPRLQFHTLFSNRRVFNFIKRRILFQLLV